MPRSASPNAAHARSRAIVQSIDGCCLSIYYLFMTGLNTRALDRELKKGSAELLILSLLDARPGTVTS